MNTTEKRSVKYRVLLGICRLFGALPNRFLYGGFARFLAFMLHRVIGYRRSVVRSNLANSFPEKSNAERADIENKFYRHLADVFIDTLKLPTITKEEIMSRVTFPEIDTQEAATKGKNWIAAMSHYGSWELAINYVLHTDHRLLAVYRPVHSPTVDQFYREARQRFGAEPLSMRKVVRTVARLQHEKEGNPYILALISDQNPPLIESKHWFTFLDQETVFYAGFEKISERYAMPVYFTKVKKVAPQQFEITFHEIYDGKESVAENEVLQRYVSSLEKMIREQPELWMWSHKRWKHKKEDVTEK